MKTYFRNNLLSVFGFSCFGIIYNILVYLFSSEAFKFMTDDFSFLFSALYYKMFKRLDSICDNLYINNQALLIILNGILSNLVFAIIFGSILTFLTNKIDDLNIRKGVWKKTLIFTITIILGLALLSLLCSYLWAVNNKDLSWLPKERVFERYIPAVWMFEYKTTYMEIGFVIGLIYFFKLKKKASH